MKEIPLTRGFIALVDDEDFEWLVKHTWCAQKSRNTWYASTWIYKPDGTKTTVAMHRLIMDAKPGQTVDHKDGNGLCNCRTNLRFATPMQNSQNQWRRGRGRSGFKGVSYSKQNITRKWAAHIWVNKRNITLGYFANPTDAAKCYDEAAIKFFGPFAAPNFKTEAN